MSRWLRWIRGAVGTGLTWAMGWAGVGILIGVAMAWLGVPMEWFVQVFDAPLPALAVPGFFAGASFSVVLGIAGRRRRFDQLSLPRFTLWGALGGFLLSLLPLSALAGTAPMATHAVVVGTLTVLSALSAGGSLVLARRVEDGELGSIRDEADAVGLDAEETRALLGGGI